MLWSKSKSMPSAEQTELERKDEIKPQDIASGTDSSEAQYPGFKIVLPTVLSVCLTVFLTALVGLLSHLLTQRLITTTRTEPLLASPFQRYQITFTPSTKLLGTSLPFSSPTAPSNCLWAKSMYVGSPSLGYFIIGYCLPPAKKTFFPAKWTFITTAVIFEIGSIVCAAAPTSPAFIVGRAIAGIGSAGTITGANIVFVDLLPLEKRAKYLGFIGATFGLASIAGPLLGGVFTTKASWRWCFWINVPIGGLAIAGLLLILPAKPPPRKLGGVSFLQRIWEFDPIGTALLLPGLVLLLLALQWAGTEYAWSSARIVVLLVLGLLLLMAFGITQLWAGDNGTVPPRIFSQRSIAAATAVSLAFGSTLIILTFYLPIWFQAIKGQSAVGAGIRLLPYFLSTVVFVIGSGVLVSKVGYYTPVLIVGTAVLIVGCGLVTTFEADTNRGEWIGYQASTRPF
jgi:MFS family permease